MEPLNLLYWGRDSFCHGRLAYLLQVRQPRHLVTRCPLWNYKENLQLQPWKSLEPSNALFLWCHFISFLYYRQRSPDLQFLLNTDHLSRCSHSWYPCVWHSFYAYLRGRLRLWIWSTCRGSQCIVSQASCLLVPRIKLQSHAACALGSCKLCHCAHKPLHSW